MQKQIDAFLVKTPVSISSLWSKDQSGCSNKELDRHSDALDDDGDDNSDSKGHNMWADGDTSDEEGDSEYDSEDSEDPINSSAATQEAPENIMLPLPSHVGIKKQQDLSINSLVDEEVIIRQSQASQALDQVRLSLGIKSAIFRKKVGPAKSQYTKTRAWKAVHVASAAVQQHARSYALAQHALVRLEADNLILTRFPPLEKSDMVVSSDVVEENRVGQRSQHVSWIWRLDIGKGLGENEWIEESE